MFAWILSVKSASYFPNTTVLSSSIEVVLKRSIRMTNDMSGTQNLPKKFKLIKHWLSNMHDFALVSAVNADRFYCSIEMHK